MKPTSTIPSSVKIETLLLKAGIHGPGVIYDQDHVELLRDLYANDQRTLSQIAAELFPLGVRHEELLALCDDAKPFFSKPKST